MNALEEGFAKFKIEAFRFEHLPEYRVSEEKPILESYIAGDLFPPVDSPAWQGYFGQWHQFVQSCKLEGRRVVRVRMLNSHPTPYLNLEIDWGYPYNALAGEEIFLISEDMCKELIKAVPEDFWLFDSTAPVTMKYSADGSYLDSLKATSNDNYVHAREILLKHAMPLKDFLAQQRKS